MRPVDRDSRMPTRRRVVAFYLLVSALVIAGMVAMAEALRYEHPAAGPPTAELLDGGDPLRDEVDCEIPEPREGEERPTVTTQPALPQPVTSHALYDCPGTWDGQRVQFVGEAVGAVLDRGERAWVQLNDDVYAASDGPMSVARDLRGGNAGIGALLAASDAATITSVGGPTQRGDLIEVVGTFRRVDADTNEVAVLDVESLVILRPGEPLETPAMTARWIVALCAAAVALAVLGLERRSRGVR